MSANVAAASAGGIRYGHVRQRVDRIRQCFTPFDGDSRSVDAGRSGTLAGVCAGLMAASGILMLYLDYSS
jgi:hypothetical protein